MVENPLHGKRKVQRDKVRHVVFDCNDKEHMRLVKELDVPSHVQKMAKRFNLVIRLYEKKPVGYIMFRYTSDPKKILINDMFVHPDYRDTVPGPKLSQTEYEIKRERILKGQSSPSHMRKRDQQRLSALDRAKNGLQKNPRQFHLIAKMCRYLAKTHGKQITSIAASPMGQKVMDRYFTQYTSDYFRRRGMKKPRKMKRL